MVFRPIRDALNLLLRTLMRKEACSQRERGSALWSPSRTRLRISKNYPSTRNTVWDNRRNCDILFESCHPLLWKTEFREICAKVVAATDSELSPILSELRALLYEQDKLSDLVLLTITLSSACSSTGVPILQFRPDYLQIATSSS